VKFPNLIDNPYVFRVLRVFRAVRRMERIIDGLLDEAKALRAKLKERGNLVFTLHLEVADKNRLLKQGVALLQESRAEVEQLRARLAELESPQTTESLIPRVSRKPEKEVVS
jgi:hypothetical protein